MRLLPIATRRFRGFTLTEMLIVISIIVVLAVATLPFLFRLGKGRAVRDATRLVQATLTGARDRAMARQNPVGVRFLPDADNPEICRAMILIEAAPALGTGTVHVVRPGPLLDSLEPALPGTVNGQQEDAIFGHPVVLVVGNGGVDWTQFQDGGLIRFEDAGPYYPFTFHRPDILRLTDPNTDRSQHSPLQYSPLADPVYNPRARLLPNDCTIPSATQAQFLANLRDVSNPGIRYTIIRDVVPLEGTEPILLPQGVVIDLGQLNGAQPYPTAPSPDGAVDPPEDRLSRLMPSNNVLNNGGPGTWDILFAPNGQVLPPQSALPQASIWLRDADSDMATDARGRRAIRANDSATHTIIYVQTRTGYVSSTKPHFVDTATDLNPSTNQTLGSADGLFDFHLYYNNVARGQSTGM